MPYTGVGLWLYGWQVTFAALRMGSQVYARMYGVPNVSPEVAITRLIQYRSALDHEGVTPRRADPARGPESLTRDERRAHARYLCDGLLMRLDEPHVRDFAPQYLAAVRSYLEYDHSFLMH